MLARLELIPRDVLENIAFLVAISPDAIFKPPQELLHLLLTSSTLYYSLCTTSAPHLYARLFRSTFDLDNNGTQFTHEYTDSRLTAELVSRYRLLRRVRRFELSEPIMYEDLCVAKRMVLESNGLNETHLRSAAFTTFIFTYAERCMKRYQARSDAIPDHSLDLVLWLLVLTWSRGDVVSITEEAKDSFLLLLRPLLFICSSDDASIIQSPRRTTAQAKHVRNRHSMDDADECEYSRFVCPSATSAAVILNFILQEAVPCEPAPQLPSPSHTDSPNGNAGPTLEDYYVMAKYQTPLFSDSCSSGTGSSQSSPAPSRTIKHDPQFFHPKLPGSNAYYQVFDLIPGLWEGVYMVSCSHLSKGASPPEPDTPDFICKKSLQCSLALYFAFGPQVGAECIADEVDQWTVTPKDFSNEEECLTIFGRKTAYESFVSSANCNCQMPRDYSQALDCLVTGQTTEEHDRVWGGYSFAGRLKRDGTIVMKREPKSTVDAGLGTWIFEGNVRYGSAFVGTWRSSTVADNGIRGLFSLAKRPRPTTKIEP
ncbi:hypothetical protein GYMLUDRAFT_93560 [Collybiopsis luxurians FD-317 M1]|nr:hypothetical protein GYMLUDRAFT_93560 [Collybiopsis luxurians FD-317 M1]